MQNKIRKILSSLLNYLLVISLLHILVRFGNICDSLFKNKII